MHRRACFFVAPIVASGGLTAPTRYCCNLQYFFMRQTTPCVFMRLLWDRSLSYTPSAAGPCGQNHRFYNCFCKDGAVGLSQGTESWERAAKAGWPRATATRTKAAEIIMRLYETIMRPGQIADWRADFARIGISLPGISLPADP